MNKSINIRQLMQALFDNETIANTAAAIGQAMLAARSLRLTEIAATMNDSSEARSKRIGRCIRQADPRQAVWRLVHEQAQFVIGDPTEIERPRARNTASVGTRTDGKTRDCWAMGVAIPYRRRAIPCGLVTSASRTIADRHDSRNRNHVRGVAGLKDLLGERPLARDRAFRYPDVLVTLVEARVTVVIRLTLGSHPPTFWDGDGRAVAVTIAPGETVIHHRVWHSGRVCVHGIGTWGIGVNAPVWVMTNLDATQAQQMDVARVNIEESVRDRNGR